MGVAANATLYNYENIVQFASSLEKGVVVATNADVISAYN